ncbi:MAG TPA: hypothetical protein VIL49_14470 [Capillimicrobium sp.]|jgi:hypothetical protein
MRSRLLLAAVAAALATAPAASADDASLTAVLTTHHERLLAAEKAVAKQLDRDAPARATGPAARRVVGALGDYAATVRSIAAAVRREEGSTDDGRRARSLFLRSVRHDLIATGYLRRSFGRLAELPRGAGKKARRRAVAKAFTGLMVGVVLMPRAERLRERGLGLLGIEYDSPILDVIEEDDATAFGPGR